MLMIRSIRILTLSILLALTCAQMRAQVATGTPPYSSLGGGPDTINLADLNSNLTIPILNKSGRGLNFNYDLGYDSTIWSPVSSSGTSAWTPDPNWGWRAISIALTGVVPIKQGFLSCFVTNPSGTRTRQNYAATTYTGYKDPHGTFHAATIITTVGDPNCDSGPVPPVYTGTATAVDGSGYIVTVNEQATPRIVVTRPNGQIINSPGSTTATVVDRNGNELTTSVSGSNTIFTDTLGTTVLTLAGSGTPASPITHTYTAPSGANAVVTVKYTTYTVQTAFGCSGITEYGGNGTTTASLVSEIDLPGNSKYTFTYEPTPGASGHVTGRLASVTFPTGGTISYTYTGGNNGIMCSDGSTAGLKRYTPDTGSAAFWSYTRKLETGAASITTVTDPTSQANQTLVQFQSGYETQRNIYQGAAPTISTFPIPESTLQTAGLLKEIQICYNGNTASCTSTAINAPITQRNITTHLSGASSWANSKTSQSIYKYNLTGSLIEQDDYDYGAGSPGSLLKKTAITYATINGIAAFRQQVSVTDGTGATVSQTKYNYGDTVTATSGTPQHTTPNASRGNLLSINYYTQGSTFLTKSYTYFDTGNVQTVTDVNGGQTTYSYGSGSCGNSFPTGLNELLSLSRSMTWNCTGGVQTSTIDENGQKGSTSFTTDPAFWRPESATDPSNAVASFTYASTTQAEAVLPVVSGSSASDKLVTLDSLGRPSLSQIRQTPGGSTFDTVETDYDITGRPTRSTLPFATTAGQKSSTAPGLTALYDPLGRVASITDSGTGSITNSFSQNDVLVTRGPAPTGENTKKHQSEYDALGRLVSVCEITAVTGSGPCSQSNPQTGFWTKYSYDPLGRLKGVTQNAQSSSTQSRSFVYDLMGRMTSETEAESGTTTYTYDTDSTCGTSSGDLVKKVDAIGDVTCYSYDTLHRVLSKKYPSGSYASVTPSKFFVYDSATVNGIAMANTKGRLAEAYTCTGSCASKITDEGFSYTARGELSDQYQSSPNSSGYYHANYLYWPNGVTKQISGLPTLPTFTYGVDPKGRINTLSASTGQNPLTATTYNSANLPTGVTFGSGDSDAYSYDSNTNRMTQYKFNVNGQAFVGNLTWNANGTLASQQTTDPFNSADTQNCTYSHDDLARIAGVNCGSTWTQTFSYDSFGNISKSGSMMFQPMYNSATNRMTSIGTFTPTYDANGNVLNNSAHTYTWDAEGKYVSVDGATSVTYDALGRKVELGYPSELLYLPDGSYILFKGQVARQGTLKLPGGGQAFYDANNGGLVQYSHADYLGSFRLASTPARGYLSSLAYAPFGEQYSAVNQGGADGFTGYTPFFAFDEYDFPARQLSVQGRWVSPDPSGPAAFHLTDPQSLNRYAYARNTPLSVVDPTGLDLEYDPTTDPVGDPSGGGSDPTIGGSQDNSGGGCGPDDPACLGPLPTPGGGGDPLNNPLSQNSGPSDPSQPYPAGVVPIAFSYAPSSAFQSPNQYGGGVTVTYQVVDQNGNPMAVADIVPVESVTVSQPLTESVQVQNSYGGCILANCGGTNSAGQFTDTPVGASLVAPGTATLSQAMYLQYQGTTNYAGTTQWSVISFPPTGIVQITNVVGSNGVSASGNNGRP